MRRALMRTGRRLALPFRPRFRQGVEDPNRPLSYDLRRRSRTLLIAFGGMAGQIGMPPFEFFKATGDIPVKRLFVRDLHQVWYHLGIPGHGETIEEAAVSLRRIADEHDVERLVVAGNSAGGYASLAFGRLMGADLALSFAPQTVLDQAVLAEWDDHRWDEQLGDLLRRGTIPDRWAELRRALTDEQTIVVSRPAATRYEIYFDATLEEDRLHAERVEGVPGIELHRIDGGEHSVALKMREEGELTRVLHDALLPSGG